jgi:hypothetical protein
MNISVFQNLVWQDESKPADPRPLNNVWNGHPNVSDVVRSNFFHQRDIKLILFLLYS